MIRKVEYIFDEPYEGIAKAEFTLGTVTVLGVGEYAKLRRIYQLRYFELIGSDPRKLSQEELDALDPDLVSSYSIWMEWAHVQTSFRSAKVWVVGDRSPEMLENCDLSFFNWDNLEGLNTLPMDLFDELVRASIMCNPRTFGGRVVLDSPSEAVNPTTAAMSAR